MLTFIKINKKINYQLRLQNTSPLFVYFIWGVLIFKLHLSLLSLLWSEIVSHSVMSDSLRPHGLATPNPPDLSVHGILQARILEWVAIPFSRASSLPRDWTCVSCITGRFFTSWDTRKVCLLYLLANSSGSSHHPLTSPLRYSLPAWSPTRNSHEVTPIQKNTSKHRPSNHPQGPVPYPPFWILNYCIDIKLHFNK